MDSCTAAGSGPVYSEGVVGAYGALQVVLNYITRQQSDANKG